MPEKKTNKAGKPHYEPLPNAVREAALKRVALGEAATAVAESIGIAPSTVTRWMKKAGVEKGQALTGEAAQLADTPAADLSPTDQLARQQQIDGALSMYMKMQDGVEDKYRMMMAQRLQAHFEQSKFLPALRSWADYEKAVKIMNQILGIDGKGGSGNANTRLDINFNVVGDDGVQINAEGRRVPKKKKVIDVNPSDDEESGTGSEPNE